MCSKGKTSFFLPPPKKHQLMCSKAIIHEGICLSSIASHQVISILLSYSSSFSPLTSCFPFSLGHLSHFHFSHNFQFQSPNCQSLISHDTYLWWESVCEELDPKLRCLLFVPVLPEMIFFFSKLNY